MLISQAYKTGSAFRGLKLHVPCYETNIPLSRVSINSHPPFLMMLLFGQVPVFLHMASPCKLPPPPPKHPWALTWDNVVAWFELLYTEHKYILLVSHLCTCVYTLTSKFVSVHKSRKINQSFAHIFSKPIIFNWSLDLKIAITVVCITSCC